MNRKTTVRAGHGVTFTVDVSIKQCNQAGPLGGFRCVVNIFIT